MQPCMHCWTGMPYLAAAARPGWLKMYRDQFNQFNFKFNFYDTPNPRCWQCLPSLNTEHSLTRLRNSFTHNIAVDLNNLLTQALRYELYDPVEFPSDKRSIPSQCGLACPRACEQQLHRPCGALGRVRADPCGGSPTKGITKSKGELGRALVSLIDF